MYIIFDIGGTKMRVAASRDGTSLASPVVIRTPAAWSEGIDALKREIRNISGGKAIRAIAGGLPGVFDREKTHLAYAANLPDWTARPIASELTREFEVPVALENDSALGGLGEALYGAGVGKNIIAYIAIGTGIGGARVVGGKIDAARHGFEPGKQILDWQNKTELERLISGSALEERYGKLPSEINEIAVWEEAARILAAGLTNTILHWSPDIVILGGSVSRRIPVDRVRAHTRELIKVYPELPLIQNGILGESAGLFGALALLADSNLS